MRLVDGQFGLSELAPEMLDQRCGELFEEDDEQSLVAHFVGIEWN